MKVRLINTTVVPADDICGQAAAVCTDTNKYESALRFAVESGHTSVLEHSVFTFEIDGISRVALAQLTRHRLASFSVQSQRYVKQSEAEVVVPMSVERSELGEEAELLIRSSRRLYDLMIENGVPEEDARYILPQGITTRLILTMNCRELLHFFSLRTCNRAQWEIRQLADEMLRLCREKCPVIFDKAGPGCVRGRCPEKRPCGHPRSGSESAI
jgi:thymidylate synthase (FAD)